MTSKDTTISNLIGCIDSVTELASQLDEDQLATRSLCPDWDVKGVLGHLFGLEQVLTGWFPTSAEDPPPFGEMSAATNALLEMDAPALDTRLRELAAARTADLEALTDDQISAPSMTPVGVATYGKFMAIRVFDFWVHEQDMRVPLGLPGNAGGPAAEQAMDEIEGSLGYIVGKKIGLDDGRSIKFTLTGPVERTMCVAVDGRAAAVGELIHPDVELTSDSLTFALLACGRIDPEGPIAEGTISWAGDQELGAHAARNLRYTM